MGQRHKVLETDNPTAKFLYTIIKQLDLKSINWNRVASDLEISNGHAARMRYSRFRQQMDGTSGVTRAKRKSKKGKTVEPQPEKQAVSPMDLSMMPKMEPMDSSLHSTPFFKSEPRIQGYPGMQEFANYPPQSISDNSIPSYLYLPQDFASRGFQYASRMPSGLPLVSSGTSSMNPYGSPDISTSYPYALTRGQAGFDTQDFGMQLPLSSFGPTISWEPRPSSHEVLQIVKLEEGQSSKAGALDLDDQFNKLPIQPADRSMDDIIDLPDHHTQYPIQRPAQSFTNPQINPTAHHQAQSIVDRYPDHAQQQTQNTTDPHAQHPSQRPAQNQNNRHVDLSAQLLAHQMADHNPHLVQEQAEEIGDNRVDTPDQRQTQPKAQNPAPSPVKHSVDRSAQTPDPRPVEISVPITSQQPLLELAQPVQQPVQQHIQQTAQTPDQNSTLKLAQYPLQQPVQQPVQTPTQEPARKPAQNPAAQEIDDGQIDYPFRYTVQQSAQNAVGEPVDNLVDCRSDESNYQPCQLTEQGPTEQRAVVQLETTQD
ncbi:hypothetical protein N7460_012454 [Penicillium canescens]|uniref:Myb-like DNA-binding domain-containing protein n=1 Tax=Penicillium canescens TaxID=5083 RepID=A0AAD6I384_PENCN|nr:hypothetical protein N7460_012454 [Penicillium canescens]